VARAFSGQPARTDRPARGFGQLHRERLMATAGQLDLRFSWSRAPMNEMISLVYGRDIGCMDWLRARSAGWATFQPAHQRSTERRRRAPLDLLPQRGTSWPSNSKAG